jgi:guanylate kinase
MEKGRLFVISGPSGAGKGTICKCLTGIADADLSISMTTRAPRPNEEDGVSYFFVSEEQFRQRIAEGGFLEYAEVFGNLYGTPKAFVCGKLNAGKDVILEIDVQGAMQVKENHPGGVFVFILPPSMDELRKRITGRRSESDAAIACRLGKALDEMSYLGAYDYCIVNGELEQAVSEVAAIISTEHLRVGDRADALIEKYRKEGSV